MHRVYKTIVEKDSNKDHKTKGDIYAQARIGHWVLDVQSKTYTLDPMTCFILGLPEGSRLADGEEDLHFFSESDQEHMKLLLERLIATGEPLNTEIQLKRPDEQSIWVMVSATAVQDKGKCVKVTGLTQDLTQIKQLEENLYRKTQLMNVTQEMAALGYWQWDVKTNMVKCSENMARLLKIEKDSLFPLTTLLKDVHPEDIDTVWKSLEMMVEQKTCQGFTHRLIHRGKVRHIKVIGEVHTDTDGNITDILGISQDITKEKLAEDKIVKAKENLELLTEELKSQNQQLEDFSYITTHNLRAPANNLNALIKLYKGAKDEREKELLFKKLEKVTGHLTLTLDTLVDSLKVKTSQSVMFEKLSLDKTLAKTKEILMAEIEETGASIKSDFSEIDHVMYVKLYLESLFQNLISNSLKYRDPDRIPEISIVTRSSNETTTLLFSDNGLGMDLGKYGHNLFCMNKVFHDHPEAKGVGLYMTKIQLESTGGHISAQSEVGKGSTFVITLKDQVGARAVKRPQ